MNSSDREAAKTTPVAGPTPLTVSEVLSKAANLLEPDGAWTQRAAARNGKGAPAASPVSWAATCWCVVGALQRFTLDLDCNVVGPYWDAFDTLERVIGRDPVEWNDTRGRSKKQVVAALRKASELAANGPTAHEPAEPSSGPNT